MCIKYVCSSFSGSNFSNANDNKPRGNLQSPWICCFIFCWIFFLFCVEKIKVGLFFTLSALREKPSRKSFHGYHWCWMSQPYCWKSGRVTLTLPKWGLGSPSGLLKLQSSISGAKTPCIEALFISLKSYQSLDVENGLAWAIWTYTA
jgi:hypothetical protein